MTPSASSTSPPVTDPVSRICSITPMMTDEPRASGRLWKRAMTAPARPLSSSVGPSPSVPWVPCVGHTRIAVNAEMAPATTHDSVTMRAALTPASEAASALSAAARVARP